MTWAIPCATDTAARSHSDAGVPALRFSSHHNASLSDSPNAARGPQRVSLCAKSPRGAVAYGSYVDEPLMMQAAGRKYYYCSNHLYSVAALTDSTGAVVERYKYDPYGRQGIQAANGVVSYSPSDYGNFIGFTGRYHDWETGLIYYRSRYEDSQLGRFLNRMPWFGMNNMTLSNYSIEVMSKDWERIFRFTLRAAQGSYIQHRYNLYDYMGDDPGNRLEPFSRIPPIEGEKDDDAEREKEEEILRPHFGYKPENEGDPEGEPNPNSGNGPNGGSYVDTYTEGPDGLPIVIRRWVPNPAPRIVCPTYRPNPAHTDGRNPRKTPEPRDAKSVFDNSMPDPNNPGTRWGLGSDGQIYRFFEDEQGFFHFSGMTGGAGGIPPDRIPISIRRELW